MRQRTTIVGTQAFRQKPLKLTLLDCWNVVNSARILHLSYMYIKLLFAMECRMLTCEYGLQAVAVKA